MPSLSKHNDGENGHVDGTANPELRNHRSSPDISEHINKMEGQSPLKSASRSRPSNGKILRDEFELEDVEIQGHHQREMQTSTRGDSSGIFDYGDSKSEGETECPPIPDDYFNLTEICAEPPVENPNEQQEYQHTDLESRQSRLSGTRDQNRQNVWLTKISTSSYLIWFSFLGVLAREGLASLTSFVDAPITYTSLWPNFTGTFILGFLSEGAVLFHHPAPKRSIARPQISQHVAQPLQPTEDSAPSDDSQRIKDHTKTALTPVACHIGLATGFCGSFTTFSGLMKDCFLALSNTLASQGDAKSSLSGRGADEDFMAAMAVLIVSLSVAMIGLKAGAHLAILVQATPYRLSRAFIFWSDRCIIPLAIVSWVATICLAALSPHSDWRGKTLFSLVFSPIGCLLRFYLSISLNAKRPSFPVGTYISNIFGTLVLAILWDIQRSSITKSSISCQVQQGLIDGFCGCLTTISTFVNELHTLRRAHAYIYGCITVLSGLVVVIVVMGTMKWVDDWSPLTCIVDW